MSEKLLGTPNRLIKAERSQQISSPYTEKHLKRALLLKLDSNLKTTYLQSLASVWNLRISEELEEKLKKPKTLQGDTKTPKDQLLSKLREHLISKKLSGDLIKAIFVVSNNQIFLLPAGPPSTEGEKAALDKNIEAAGIKTVRDKLSTDAAYRNYIHLNFATIKDDIARDAAHKLSRETEKDYYKIIEYSIIGSDMSDSDDSLDLKIIETEAREIMANVLTSEGNNEESSNDTQLKIPKIDKFSEKNNVDAWLDNATFILEMAGLRDKKKIIAHLLGGLDQNLLLSVRQALQSKTGDLTTEDFRQALRQAAHQTDSDMVRQMQRLKYTDDMTNLKDLYLKISSLNRALFPKITDETTRTNLDTREFKEKCPKDIKNHSVFKTSDKTGYELVALAQRLLDANKNEMESNYFNSGRRNQQNSNGRNQFQNRGFKNNRPDGRRHQNYGQGHQRYKSNNNFNRQNYNNNYRPNRSSGQHNGPSKRQNNQNFRREIRCNFCQNKGHIEDECNTKERMRQEYLGRDRKYNNRK